MLSNQRGFIANLISSKNFQEFTILENLHKKLFDISFSTTSVQLYQIKLQWYLDSLMNEDLSGVPEVDAFKILAIKYNFISADILKFVKSYSLNADEFPFSSMENLTNYARNTEGSLWLFYATILKISNSKIRRIIEDIACVYGSVGIIRNTSFYSKHQRSILIFKEDVNINTLKQEQVNLQHLLSNLKSLSNTINLDKKSLPKFFKPILLLQYFARSYIKQIEKHNGNYQKIALVNLTKLDNLKIFFRILLSFY